MNEQDVDVLDIPNLAGTGPATAIFAGRMSKSDVVAFAAVARRSAWRLELLLDADRARLQGNPTTSARHVCAGVSG